MSAFRTIFRRPSKVTFFVTCGGLFSFLGFSSSSKDLSVGDRLLNLLDYYNDKPAGMWHQLYHARVYFKQFFDDTMNDKTGQEFAKNWCKMRAYICAMDGLSKQEKEAICNEVNCWCPIISKEEFGKLCEIGAKFTEEEAQKTCDIINQTYTIEARRALLLNSLCGAAVDGLDIHEIEGFIKVAEKLKINNETAQEIYSLYMLEKELKEKYNQFYLSHK